MPAPATIHDTIMLADDLKVLVFCSAGPAPWRCYVTVYRATPAAWETLATRTLALSVVPIPESYNGGHFEKFDNGRVRILVTPLFVLMVAGETCVIQQCSSARLVVGNSSIWIVGEVPFPAAIGPNGTLGMSRLCALDPYVIHLPSVGNKRPRVVVNEGGWDRFADPNPLKRQCFGRLGRDDEASLPMFELTRYDTIWGTPQSLFHCTVLDASWDSALGSILCLVSDETLFGFKLNIVEMSNTRPPCTRAIITNRHFANASMLAASFLNCSTDAFICAMRSDARSVFTCDSRSGDVSFLSCPSMCRIDPTYIETLNFVQVDGGSAASSNYAFLQQTGRYPLFCDHARNSWTRMHIFDLRTMSCVDTVESPVPVTDDVHIRMVPRVLPGTGITVEAYRTMYGADFSATGAVKRVPVKSAAGMSVWTPLNEGPLRGFPVPATAQVDRSTDTSSVAQATGLVLGHRAREFSSVMRLKWVLLD